PWLERAIGICQDADLPVVFPGIAATLGAAYTLAGRVADAVSLPTRALEQSVATGTVAYQALCRLSLRKAQLLAGRLEEAHTLAEHTLALTREHGGAARRTPCAFSATLRRGASLRSAYKPKPTTSRPALWLTSSA